MVFLSFEVFVNILLPNGVHDYILDYVEDLLAQGSCGSVLVEELFDSGDLEEKA